MSDDKKADEGVYGISSGIEDPARVIGGYGETTKRLGAKTKEVQNVSFENLCVTGEILI